MKEIFVFGSNLSGIHGAGAAKHAMQHEGAQWGVGEGRTGNSYALPTKDQRIMTLPVGDVAQYVERFLRYANNNLDQQFKVTRVGCGLAGFKDSVMSAMFINAPFNCYFDEAWQPYLGDSVHYWGTM